MLVTVQNANDFLQTSGEDKAMEWYIAQATLILQSLCNVASFDTGNVSEVKKYNANGPYYLNCPIKGGNSITAINGEATTTWVNNTDYLIRWSSVIFDKPISSDKWGNVTIQYDAWYTTVPEDLKKALLLLVAGVRSKAKGLGVQSFTQGDLSVTYSNDDSIFWTAKAQKTLIDLVISKYKFTRIYS